MKPAPDLAALHARLNAEQYGGLLPPTPVLLAPGWHGPRFAAYVPETIVLSAPWYAFHRDRRDRLGRAYPALLLLHEMAHQAAHVLLGDPAAGLDHGRLFRLLAVPGVEEHAPVAAGFLRSLPVRFRYVCPLCAAGWSLPYALSAAERVCLRCAARHGAKAARVRVSSKRRT